MAFVSTASQANSSGGLRTLVDTSLGAGTGSWAFASGLPANASMLRVVLSGTTDRAATSLAQVAIRFNGDAGANYDYEFQSSNAAFSGSTVTAGNQIELPFWGGATSPVAFSSFVIVDIPFYSGTTANKRVVGYGFSGLGDARGTLVGGLWRSNAAITAITLVQLNAANIVAGARATVFAW